MTIKRLVLSLLTFVAVFFAGVSLLSSWNQPQIQSRLELYQTSILLQAAQWQSEPSNGTNLAPALNTLVGEQPLEQATKQYEAARKSAQTNWQKAQTQLAAMRSQPGIAPTTTETQPNIAPVTDPDRNRQQQQLQRTVSQLERLTAELDLRLGILQVQQNQSDRALESWNSLAQEGRAVSQALRDTANALAGLWSDPPRLLPNAQQLIQTNLDGWFRYRALEQLYQLQQRQAALTALQAAEQQASEQALLKLALISSIPAIGGLLGVALLIFLVVQRLLKGKEAVLAQNEDTKWSTPWDGETVWQVFVVGFFLMGQLLVPLIFSLLQSQLAASGGIRIQAFYILINYLLLAAGGIGVLYLSIKQFFPLPESWFCFKLRDNWLLWGLGGYCVALPIVVVVSLINQQLWNGQGGSNPLLSLALQAQDRVALAIFFFTAAIAAPLFEELMFRGFLLPSLTRYLPVWAAVLTSALLFAVAHLSLSEILPLTALGIVLGVVYTRSRNLLAPMLLHSLWNSGTLISLFILGSSSS